MPYYSGAIIAVPNANKQDYVEMAEKMWEIVKDHGCLGSFDNWGVDVPDGKVTSFPMAVKLKDDETVVFAWMEWPDKATADKGMEAMMSDPRSKDLPEMPFDGMRMIWGGFEPLVHLTV
jgi:uncharacterized protein YbaA (DUF1428 family)